jgi:hypothetical protein
MTRAALLSFAAFAALAVVPSSAVAQTSWGLGVARDGSLVFCDNARSTVWRVAPTGERSAVMEGVNCRAVTTGLDGDVYGEVTPLDVTSTRGVGVWRLDAAFGREWLQPPTPMPEPGIWIARDAEGASYAWAGSVNNGPDSAIIRRDRFDVMQTIAGGPRGRADGLDPRFDNVIGLAAAPDGSVLVLDSGDLRRVRAGGVTTTEARAVATNRTTGLLRVSGLFGREAGIASDLQSEAVIVDAEANRIVHVSRTGRQVIMWSPSSWVSRMTNGRWGWRAAGVAMRGRTFYVLDQWIGPALVADLVGSPRVTQIDDAGHVTRVAQVVGWTARVATAAFALILLSLVVHRARPRT